MPQDYAQRITALADQTIDDLNLSFDDDEPIRLPQGNSLEDEIYRTLNRSEQSVQSVEDALVCLDATEQSVNFNKLSGSASPDGAVCSLARLVMMEDVKETVNSRVQQFNDKLDSGTATGPSR